MLYYILYYIVVDAAGRRPRQQRRAPAQATSLSCLSWARLLCGWGNAALMQSGLSTWLAGAIADPNV